jgi:hypothetical protein
MAFAERAAHQPDRAAPLHQRWSGAGDRQRLQVGAAGPSMHRAWPGFHQPAALDVGLRRAAPLGGGWLPHPAPLGSPTQASQPILTSVGRLHHELNPITGST